MGRAIWAVLCVARQRVVDPPPQRAALVGKSLAARGCGHPLAGASVDQNAILDAAALAVYVADK
jgi:hypothetical protein